MQKSSKVASVGKKPKAVITSIIKMFKKLKISIHAAFSKLKRILKHQKLSRHQLTLSVLWVVFGLAALGGIFFTLSSLSTHRLTCKSTIGNISITYNDEEITGYSASRLTYDFSSQQAYAKQIGVEEYLDEFSAWFASNTDGTCHR